MREILFRGKRKNGYDWIYGNYCGVECSLESGCGIECFIIEAPRDGSSVKVDAETVGQYTGLIDKNDQKIFEGDIVRGIDHLADLEVFGYIDHQSGSFVIVGEFMTHYRWLDYEVEVIGNIYDNPELIET